MTAIPAGSVLQRLRKLAGRPDGAPASDGQLLDRFVRQLERLPTVQLPELRALEALERTNSPEARRLIQTLAEGESGAWLTQEARATLARLGERGVSTP